ncbi:MAG: cytochrome d ubiquinol oxidase subunit II [Sulfobacillus sp.]
MNLNVLWFVLIGVLFVGYFFLEGFDYGVGMIYQFLGHSDTERRVALNAIGPTWGANEVWLITAGGAIFAAFPEWYATLFSGFYLALVLMLLGLIARGVALEYRSRHDNPGWRRMWDWALTIGSFIPALLWGVAVANLVRGVPINSQMNFTGNLLTLLNPYALWSGLAMVVVFLAHGAYFLSMKTRGMISYRAKQVVKPLGYGAVAMVLVLLLWTATLKDLRLAAVPALVGLAALILIAAAVVAMTKNRIRWAFFLHGAGIALLTVSFFAAMFPRVMISSLNPQWSLTIYNAASNSYTLQVMTIVALTMVPIVLAYQVWTYWIFRRRVGTKSFMEY